MRRFLFFAACAPCAAGATRAAWAFCAASAFMAGLADRDFAAGASKKKEMMNFKIPEPSEEEQGSKTIPDDFKCDACKAAIYQLTLAIDRVKPKDRSTLMEAGGKKAVQAQAAQVAEVLEETCSTKTFEDYGLKTLVAAEGQSGVQKLDGPGLDVQGAGSTRGGGLWPSRLRGLCGRIVGEEEESGLVSRWTAGSLPELCDLDCGKAKREPRKARKQKAKPSPSPKKEKPPLTGLEELPPPPHLTQQVDRQSIGKFTETTKKKKFHLVLFFDTSPNSAQAVAILELAARILDKAKEADLRKVKSARYNSTDGDTFGFDFSSLPKMLFWRKGYKNPKAYNGDMNGPHQIIDWVRNEVLNVYMKDDPAAYPRLSEKKSEL
mmetsp:Transcript_27255/g.51484  ORF Transcript_27255/g.51484 Transcript_27255/m.51484 type:complete len:378 (-) Transcript_27255:123-1256(-)